MIGRTLAHYRITAAIGAGAMGQVYRATDMRLGRDVALKVLPAGMASNLEMRERFRLEARAVAALNHPHIVTIHSVEDVDGVDFLTMELVEGQSLDRLIPAGGLDVPRILDIGTALCGALAAAHERGIIHRDLKPGNVMVTHDGRAKVLDFGLAKFQDPTANGLDDDGATRLKTREGLVMGTRPYMSPEQVQGHALDHRTDIFSLGVMLYEMTAGLRPFQGDSSAELVAAILRDAARPVTEVRADLPDDLSRVITRCLEKDPRQRFQSARDVGHALRDIPRPLSRGRAGEVASSSVSPGSGGVIVDEGFRLAVLPFKSAGAGGDLAALAEGMSEDIVTGLSRFSYLKVVATGATTADGSDGAELKAVSSVARARYVLAGRLRQVGSQLRVAVQLIDGATDAHIWADTYDRPFDAARVFEIQDDLVPRIVSTVADPQGVLLRKMCDALRSKDPDALSPYEAVLRSTGYGHRVSSEEHAAVLAGLERAVERAPAYADAWGMLSLIHSLGYANGFDVGPDPLGYALTTARRAAEEGPSSALAFNALAHAYFFRRDLHAFRAAAERTLECNPLNSPAVANMGFMFAYSGDWDRGCALVERAAQISAHHAGWYWFPLFYNAYRQGDYRGALGIALKINLPRYFYNHVALAIAHGQLGDRDAAAMALRDLQALKPDLGRTAREEFRKWFQPDMVEHIIEGLRKAGLGVP